VVSLLLSVLSHSYEFSPFFISVCVLRCRIEVIWDIGLLSVGVGKLFGSTIQLELQLLPVTHFVDLGIVELASAASMW